MKGSDLVNGEGINPDNIRESTEWCIAVFDGCRDAIFLTDVESRFIEINKAAEVLTGYSRQELLGMTIPDLHDPVDRTAYDIYFERIFNGEEITSEAKIRRKDGTYVITEFSNKRIIVNKIKFMHTIARDITERRNELETIKKNEEFLRVIIENSREGINLFDIKTRKYILMSPSQVALTGFSSDEIQSITAEEALERVHPDDRHISLAQQERITNGDNSLGTVEYRWQVKSGEYRWFSDSRNVIRDNNGSPVYLVGNSIDITKRKLTEKYHDLTISILDLINRYPVREKLIASIVDLFRKEFDFHAVGIRLHDGEDYPYYQASGFPEGFVLMENKLCEYNSENELIRDKNGNPVLECMCGNILCGRVDPSKPFFTKVGSFWSNCTTELLASTTEEDRQTRTRNRCNGEGFESVALIPLRFGTVTFGLLQLNDHRRDMFTKELIEFFESLCYHIATALERILTDEELKKKEAKTRALIENADGSIWSIDKNFRLIESNSLYLERIRSVTGQNIKIGENVLKFLPEEIKRDWIKYYKKGLSGIHFSIEAETKAPLKPMYHRYVFNPILDHNRAVIGLTIIAHNITDLIKSQNQLIKSEERFRQVAESAGEWIWEVDTTGKYTYVSPLSKSLLGYSPKEILGKKYFYDFFAPDVREELKAAAFETFRAKRAFRKFENPNVHKDGHILVLETSGFPIVDEKGNLLGYRGADTDITKRIQTDRKLRDSEEKYRVLSEQGGLGIGLYSADGKILYFNNKALKNLGGKKDDFIGRSLTDVFGEEAGNEYIRRIGLAIKTGKSHEYEDYIETPSGNCWFLSNHTRICDSEGKIIGVQVLAHDISDKINYENELKKSSEILRDLNRYIAEDREEYRKKLSLDLHDDLGQKLTAIKMDIGWVRKRMGVQAAVVSTKFDSIDKLLEESVEVIQKISSELRPGILYDLGLPAAIEWQLGEFSKSSGIKCKVKIVPSEMNFNDKISITIFRIIQESLTNIMRHAHASIVKVILKADQSSVRLSVYDNGVGISDFAINDPKSFGIVGMRERARAYGGDTIIKNIPGKGTKVEVSIPLL